MKDYFGPMELDEPEKLTGNRPKVSQGNFEGDRYGSWTVGKKHDARYKYICTCDCGFSGVRNIMSLRSYKSIRCSKCYRKSNDAARFQNQTPGYKKKKEL